MEQGREEPVAQTPSGGPFSMNLGSSINAFSASPSNRQLVAAGRELLKVVSAETFEEIVNIRVGKVNLNYSSNDVKWNPFEQQKHWIASAATNGAVVLWNLDSKGKKLERVITDHSRTVNRICWNPYDPFSLLSGSQDGTMKMWDFREPEGKPPINFNAKCEVRDVQYSPFNSFLFAAGLENGSLQLWDARRNATPMNQVNLHQGLVLALMWHPSDRNLIATGGRDRVIQIWDTRSKAPSHSVQTISSVGKITWRPTHHGTRALTQIASSASLVDNSVHLWDYKRPYIPLASLSGAKDVVTGHLWTQTGNMLLTCSKDGSLRLHDLDKQAYEPRKNIAATAISWNVRNGLVVMKESINRQENVISIEPPASQGESTIMKYVGFAGTSAAPAFEKKAPTTRSASLFVPPRCTKEMHRIAKQLKARFGIAPTSSEFDPGFDTALLQYFAECYRFQGASIGELCEFNSNVARAVGKHDIAQSWVMLRTAFASAKELMQFVDSDLNNGTVVEDNNEPRALEAWEGDYIDFDADPGDVKREIYPGYINDFYRYYDFLEGGHKGDFLEMENPADGPSIEDTAANHATAASASPELDEQYYRDVEDAKWHILNDVIPGAYAKTRGGVAMALAADPSNGGDGMISPREGPAGMDFEEEFNSIEDLEEEQDPSENSTSFDLLPRAPVSLGISGSEGLLRPMSPSSQHNDELNLPRSPDGASTPGGDSQAESGASTPQRLTFPTTPNSRSISATNPRLTGMGLHPSSSSTNSSLPPSRGLETPPIGSGILSPPGDDWDILPPSAQLRSPEDMLFYSAAGGNPGHHGIGAHPSSSLGSIPSSQTPSGTHTPSEMIVGMANSSSAGPNDFPRSSSSSAQASEFLDDIEPISVVAPVLTPMDLRGEQISDADFSAGIDAALSRAATTLQSEREFSAWDSIAQSVFKFYQNQGDVQTCVYMALVLHDMVQLPKKQVMSWFVAYVDILHRLQLYNYATEIIKCAHLDSIKEMNKKSTSYSTSCPNCNKALLKKSGVTCDRCHKNTATCSICHLTVKGGYVWCQGCGHGGHADHLREWFKSNQACPTGCGHICNFQRASKPGSSSSTGGSASTAPELPAGDRSILLASNG